MRFGFSLQACTESTKSTSCKANGKAKMKAKEIIHKFATFSTDDKLEQRCYPTWYLLIYPNYYTQF